MPDFRSEDALLRYAKRLEGLRVSEISRMVCDLDRMPRNYTKGVIARIIETDYFGIPPNTYEEPDFRDLGIELKVSPLHYVPRPGLINAKERNVICMVDYFDIYNNPSWHDNRRLSCKLERILFVFYLHDHGRPADQWRILTTFLWTPNSEEDRLIQQDYDIIREKIIEGERNSEGDNRFLGTCPKHQGGFNRQNPRDSRPGSTCEHPTMGIAERRGFCIRNVPVTIIVARHGLNTEVVKKGRTIGIEPTDFEVLR